MTDTTTQYQEIISRCKRLFEAKMGDYGPACVFCVAHHLLIRYISSKRIRTLQMKDLRKIDEDIDQEFIGIVNYAAMAINQLRLGIVDMPDLEPNKAAQLHAAVLQEAFELMERKIMITTKPGAECV